MKEKTITITIVIMVVIGLSAFAVWRISSFKEVPTHPTPTQPEPSPTLMPTYRLTILSSPVSGVSLEISGENISRIFGHTPFEATLKQGYYKVSIAELYADPSRGNYKFDGWDDGITKVLRDVNLAANIVITAYYKPYEEPPPKPTYKLGLTASRLYREYGYIIAEGTVKNICNEKLDDVVVVIMFYTSDGTFVKSESALIEYNPILPNQTSPWKVITTDNPAITKCSIEFKEFFGGTIPTKDMRQ